MSELILIVDDDPGIRHLIGRELERAGFSVARADSPEAALEALAALPPVTAVVSDLEMGYDVDGVGLLWRVQQRIPHAIRVLVTGSRMSAKRRRRVLALGIAHHILAKPWPTGAIAAALRQEVEVDSPVIDIPPR